MIGEDRSSAETAPVEAPAAAARGIEPRALVRRLVANGWTPREAGNMAAHVHGLRSVRPGWTAEEIEHLLFLKALVAAGRLAP